jgi:16S rRNA processing protein RimM
MPPSPSPAASPARGRVLLGRIADAHGIRGEVLIHSYASLPEDIGAYGALSDAAGTRTFEFQSARATAKGVVARLVGIADRTAAEALRGTELFIDRDKLPQAGEDEFYHADLIGLAAVDPDGNPIGTIVTVQNFGAGDLLEIRLTGSGRTELVPFTEATVPAIDLATRRAIVVLPPTTGDEEE